MAFFVSHTKFMSKLLWWNVAVRQKVMSQVKILKLHT